MKVMQTGNRRRQFRGESQENENSTRKNGISGIEIPLKLRIFNAPFGYTRIGHSSLCTFHTSEQSLPTTH